MVFERKKTKATNEKWQPQYNFAYEKFNYLFETMSSHFESFQIFRDILHSFWAKCDGENIIGF